MTTGADISRASTIAKMYGDDVVGGHAALVITACKFEGIERTLFGGILFGQQPQHKTWERIEGTLILIPSDRVLAPRHMEGWRLDHLVTEGLHREKWEPVEEK